MISVALCPEGSEGASYAMFTTAMNCAINMIPALSTMALISSVCSFLVLGMLKKLITSVKELEKKNGPGSQSKSGKIHTNTV